MGGVDPSVVFGVGGTVALMGFAVWQVNRRLDQFEALRRKYGLVRGQRWEAGMDPGIRGWILGAHYPMYLTGIIDGVHVAVFDYAIGWGRNSRNGSGVGVGRLVAGAERMRWRMEARQADGWTYVYTDAYSPIGWRLSVARLETLMLDLLHALAQDGSLLPDGTVGGGVHIRPRRRGWSL